MAWGPSGYVYSLTPGNSLMISWWFPNFAPEGVQLARPCPEVLGKGQRTGSNGYLDCRLVASSDGVDRLQGNQYRYSVVVYQDPAVGPSISQPVFRLAGGTLA